MKASQELTHLAATRVLGRVVPIDLVDHSSNLAQDLARLASQGVVAVLESDDADPRTTS
jgi:hypothetical protein